MNPGADPVNLGAILEPSTSGAAGAFNVHANDAPDGLAPGEWIAGNGGLHRATSCQSTETSRPVVVRIHSAECLVRTLTISAPFRLRGSSAPRRWTMSTAAAARLRW